MAKEKSWGQLVDTNTPYLSLKAAGLLKACISAWEERRERQSAGNGNQMTPMGPSAMGREWGEQAGPDSQPADSASSCWPGDNTYLEVLAARVGTRLLSEVKDGPGERTTTGLSTLL